MSIRQLISNVNLFAMAVMISLILVNPAFAKEIIIETDIKTEVIISKKALKVTVGVKNKGDETAYSVFPSIVFKDENYVFENPIDLAAGKDAAWEEYIEMDLLDVKLKGTYPLLLLICFEDANGYPFSTPRLGQFNYGKHTVSRIAIKNADFDIIARGKVTIPLILQNLDAIAKEIELSVFHAKEIISQLKVNKITLPANAQKEIQVDFENFKSLLGTTSLVHFIVQYQHKNKHYCEVATSNLSVKEKTEPKSWYTNSWLFLLALVAIIFIYLVLTFRKRGRYA